MNTTDTHAQLQGNSKAWQVSRYRDNSFLIVAHIYITLVCLLMTNRLVWEYEVRNGHSHAFLTGEGNSEWCAGSMQLLVKSSFSCWRSAATTEHLRLGDTMSSNLSTLQQGLVWMCNLVRGLGSEGNTEHLWNCPVAVTSRSSHNMFCGTMTPTTAVGIEEGYGWNEGEFHRS